MVALFYSILQNSTPIETQYLQIACMIIMLCLLAIFGHMINDFSDKDVDRAAGKTRPIAIWPSYLSIVILTLLAAINCLIAYLIFDPLTVYLTIFTILLGGFYSIKPLRFKEKGFAGWATAALAQRSLPIIIIFQAFNYWDFAAVALIIVSTIIGVRSIIVHQVTDLQNDLNSSVETVATLRGINHLKWLMVRVFFPMEILFAATTIILMSSYYPALGIISTIYLLWILYDNKKGQPLNVMSYNVFHYYYNLFWPVILATIIAFEIPLFTVAIFFIIGLHFRNLNYKIREYIKDKKIPANSYINNTSTKSVSEKQSTSPVLTEKKFNKANPHPFYARMRNAAPVHLFKWPGLGDSYLVFRYQDSTTVFKDPRFVKNLGSLDSHKNTLHHQQRPHRGFGPDMLEYDPPDHTRLRNLVSKAFTPRLVEEQLTESIQRLVNGLLDNVHSSDRIEVVSQYAGIIPITVITDMLGVPITNPTGFRNFLYQLTMSQATRKRDPRLEKNKIRFTNYLKTIFSDRRKEPQDDLVTALVLAEQDGDMLTEAELIGMTYLLLIGGYLTTLSLISSGILTLCKNPGQLELLKSNRDLIGSTVEEVLRYEGPMEFSTVHYAKSNIEFDGCEIPAGASVYVVLPSANRDVNEFPDPDVFDIQRSPNRHLSFGQGIHYCLGAPLARLEGKIAIQTIFERYPNLQLAISSDEVPWLRHPIIRCPARIPLKL